MSYQDLMEFFVVLTRVDDNVSTPGGQIDIFRFEVKFDNGNTLNFKYEVIIPIEDLYISGNFPKWSNSPYSQTRREKLRLASSKVWQVGWYLPTTKFSGSAGYHHITNHICLNI